MFSKKWENRKNWPKYNRKRFALLNRPSEKLKSKLMNHPNTDHQSDTLLSDINTQPPKRTRILLNDDYTTMEFVVES